MDQREKKIITNTNGTFDMGALALFGHADYRNVASCRLGNDVCHHLVNIFMQTTSN